MGTVITLPIRKHTPENTDTEDVSNAHQNMWNDMVNIQLAGVISLSSSHKKKKTEKAIYQCCLIEEINCKQKL